MCQREREKLEGGEIERGKGVGARRKNKKVEKGERQWESPPHLGHSLRCVHLR